MQLIGIATHENTPNCCLERKRKHHLSDGTSQSARQPSYWEMKILKIYTNCLALTGKRKRWGNSKGK